MLNFQTFMIQVYHIFLFIMHYFSKSVICFLKKIKSVKIYYQILKRFFKKNNIPILTESKISAII